MEATIAQIDDHRPMPKVNPSLWVSYGRSRFDTSWQNKEVLWSTLLSRFSHATQTQETQAEYLKMSKAQQDNIKDVGGFVGGTLKGGRRKSETVEKRSMICLDLDNAPDSFIDDMFIEEPVCWAIYSTHKHKKGAARFRMIIPLSREVTPEEYEAVSRMVAKDIGLKYFDSTTFQPARLMYWPSYSLDGDYVFDYNDAELLNPDEILKRYPDWTDVSSWPTCPDELRVEKKRKERQADPTKKDNSVGLFCRAYTVPEAISEFLPDVYTQEKEDRYTYAAGSTHGGLVIYDDGLFCYSNHSTDPAHGLDLNAFDLVRIHLFGDQDEKAKEGTPSTKLPSYKAMVELVNKDKKCNRLYDAEKAAKLSDAFAGEDEEAAGDDDDSWKDELARSKNAILPTLNNLMIILGHDKRLLPIKFNSFKGVITKAGPTPWEKAPGLWDNADDSSIRVYLAQTYADFKKQDIQDAIVRTSRQRAFHPVKQYLERLPEWDGLERAETVFIDLLGAEDSAYTREATRKWLLAAVERIYRPGIKFDQCIVLTGAQGIGKSTLARKLGGEWFSDSLAFEDMRDKTAAEKLAGAWILEIGEMKGLRKMDMEAVRSFMSRQEDVYRPAYGRQTEHYPRSCVFIGTSNNDDFLRDVTGNRRFWPIKCLRQREDKRPGAWDIDQDTVDQIWAEVMCWHMIGEDLTLSKESEAMAEQSQEEALEQDERAGIVEEYLSRLLPENWGDLSINARRMWLDDRSNLGDVKRTAVSVIEVWAECFGKNPSDKKRSDSDDIARILQTLGWKRSSRTARLGEYGKQKIYEKSGTSDSEGGTS